MEATRKSTSMLSKKRYCEITKMLTQVIQDDKKVQEALQKLQEIMNFDPDMSTYTPELGKKKHASLKKRCEETGKSTYELLHAKRLLEKRNVDTTKNI